MDVSEDLADEIGVGDVFDDAELSAAEGTKRDVDVKDPFESLRPGEWCAGRFGGGVDVGVLVGWRLIRRGVA